jgi:hypothetical protein
MNRGYQWKSQNRIRILCPRTTVEDTMIAERYERPPTSFPPKSYLLNQKDRFAWFSPEWNAELQELWDEPGNVDEYLGQHFFDLLSGASIRSLYRSLFKIVRQSPREPMSLTVRCDHYPFKIILSQELNHEGEDWIKVELAYVSCEVLENTESMMPFPKDHPLKMCSWCQSVFDDEHDAWLPFEKALGHFPLLHDTEIPSISHGCCPVCYQMLRGRIHEHSRRR